MGTCRHKMIEPDSYDDRFRGCVVERWRCRRCKETVGMGPAADTYNSYDELRAAELAVHSIEAWLGGCPGSAMTAERWGWEDFERVDEDDSALMSSHWYSGWLARAIVEHDDLADELKLVHANPDDRIIRAGAPEVIGLTPRQVRERQAEADRVEDHLRAAIAATEHASDDNTRHDVAASVARHADLGGES